MRGSLILCLLAASAAASHSEVFLADSFSYADGPLQIVSANKWAGHSGATNQVDVSGGRVNLTGAETQDVNALLTFSGGSPPSTLYTRFRLRVTALPSAAGSYFAHFKDDRNGFRGRLWLRASPANTNTFRVGIGATSSAAPDAEYPVEMNLNAEYVVVTRYNATNAVSALWINPVSETDPPVISESGASIALAAYAFRQATGMGDMTIDDLIVADSFLDVVPNDATSPGQVPVQLGPPADIRLTIGLNASGTTIVQWNAEQGRPYSIWRAADLAGPYNLLASSLQFIDASAVFIDGDPIGAAQFYRVSSP